MTMNITDNTIKALTTIINYGKPFYADEVELNGGTIAALDKYDFIEETGETKTIIVDLYDNYCKKVEIKQWVINDKGIERAKREILKKMDLMTKFLDTIANV